MFCKSDAKPQNLTIVMHRVVLYSAPQFKAAWVVQSVTPESGSDSSKIRKPLGIKTSS